ncbi:metal-dependent hydrolase family protein [Guptibacillus spartinae]|uniref:metal-dependent hydrolase family protein n=1 Tax=Guptibacillus spartinae TaxID=3025679 RepID=UPI00236186E3|nr:amidohydrolase family protein [Pseudalkalibacillus spartinae]
MITVIKGSIFTGEEWLEDSAVAFNEKEVRAVGEKARNIEADTVIYADGKTVLPALIDCHVHLTMDGEPDPFEVMLKETEAEMAFRAIRNAHLHLSAGVLTVRSLGAKDHVDISFRNSVKKGVVSGPRIVASGEPIVMTGGHGHVMAVEADGETEVRKSARLLLKKGADVVKLMATGGVMTTGVEPGSPQLSETEMRAACEEANHAGQTTAAHAQGVTGIKNAIRAGITSVEHGIFLDDEAIELMIHHGTHLVPTLAAPFHIVENGIEAGIPEDAVRKAEAVMTDHRESFIKAYQAGVKIATGSDAGTPFNLHGDYVTEVKLMVESGMRPIDALKASTITAAQLLQVDSVTGSIEPGKKADLLLVNGNPIENIENLRNIEQVYQSGRNISNEFIGEGLLSTNNGE